MFSANNASAVAGCHGTPQKNFILATAKKRARKAMLPPLLSSENLTNNNTANQKGLFRKHGDIGNTMLSPISKDQAKNAYHTKKAPVSKKIIP